MSLFLSALGLVILCYRLGLRRKYPRLHQPQSWPRVSIIVPARNEERNLPALLASLVETDYPDFEIIVIDDHSTDRTSDVAKKFKVSVLAATPKPEGWVGKTWACAEARRMATGELLLFTDADTRHDSSGLKRAVAYMLEKKAGLLTSPPYHLTPTWWERGLGLFHFFTLILTAYRQSPHPSRKFAIGQYLLFQKEVYETVGGHAAVPASMNEDMDLAEKVLKAGLGFVVYPDADLYSVRMAENFGAFVKAWKRWIRLGFKRSTFWGVVDLLLVLQTFIAIKTPAAFLLMVLAVIFLVYRQRHFGQFTWPGALLYPLSILLFTAITIWATMGAALKRPIIWRARSYSDSVD